MRKKNLFVIFSSVLFFFLISCAANKSIYTRGWVGGTYKKVSSSFWNMNSEKNIYGLPNEIRSRQNSALLITEIFENTPAFTAQLQKGDLICRINNEPVTSLNQFYKIIEKCAPASVLDFEIYRADKFIVKQVKVGKEEFKKTGTISIGLSLSSRIDLNFINSLSLLDLAGYDFKDNRAELNSVEWNYEKKIPNKMIYKNNQSENWKIMLGIFQLGGHKEILSQIEN